MGNKEEKQIIGKIIGSTLSKNATYAELVTLGTGNFQRPYLVDHKEINSLIDDFKELQELMNGLEGLYLESAKGEKEHKEPIVSGLVLEVSDMKYAKGRLVSAFVSMSGMYSKIETIAHISIHGCPLLLDREIDSAIYDLEQLKTMIIDMTEEK